ncbi:MAG: 2-dehydropantoate 2-reductase [Immundisolibacteraceae bacterium]|nr:2-dehydropantoate 2-reductase [Immundisolibacteraceae bacterium]
MITVIQGAGALGSIMSALLVRSGQQVVLLARGDRANYLRKQGVTLTGLVETTVNVPIETDPTALPEADLFITTVKTYDTKSALSPLLGQQFRNVFSVQNGVLKNQQLTALFGTQALLGCAANVSGELLDNGDILFTQNRGLYIGEPTGGLSSRVERISSLFDTAGLKTIASPQINTVEWSKFIPWSAVMTLSVLTRMPTWQFCSNPHSAEYAANMVKEAAQVANSLNIEINDDGPLPASAIASAAAQDAIALVQAVGADFHQRAPQHRMSTLQDLLHGKRLEIEETLGYLLTLGVEQQIEMPVSTAAYQLLRAINSAQ